MRSLSLGLALLVAGCQTRSEAPAAARDAAAPREAVAPADAEPEVADEPAEPAPAPAPEPDDSAAAAPEALGAIPAWRAVVDRDRYLARRGQRGVVAGRVGEAVPPAPLPSSDADAGVVVAQPSDLVWLVDETDGNGALGIRVRFAEPPALGARVAVRGAWALDEARRWYWQAETVTPLPAAEPTPEPKDPPAAPGHVIAAADPPGGWSKVKSPDKASPGDLMAFTVVDKPLREGDGWGVSDRKWGTLLATVRLPGERDSYGGHDLRAPDERWALKKGGTYWVRAGKIRRPTDGVPVIEAVTAPVRIP
jgi:hypothetical protein